MVEFFSAAMLLRVWRYLREQEQEQEQEQESRSRSRSRSRSTMIAGICGSGRG